jgi:hypothetical protein
MPLNRPFDLQHGGKSRCTKITRLPGTSTQQSQCCRALAHDVFDVHPSSGRTGRTELRLCLPLAPVASAARDAVRSARNAAGRRSALLSICQRQPSGQPPRWTLQQQLAVVLLPRVRLVGLSCSVLRTRSGPLGPAVIGRRRRLHGRSKTMPSLGSRARW